MQPNTVRNGDTVVLQVKDDRHYIVRVQRDKTVSLYSKEIPADKVIGLSFSRWYTFSADGDSFTVTAVPDISSAAYRAVAADGEGDASSVAGCEHVRERLLETASFVSKTTEFSRQKQAARARATHAMLVRLELATPYNVCAHISESKNADSYLSMSPASLSLMLQYAEPSRLPGKSRVLVYDDTAGRVSAAVAHRLSLTDTPPDACSPDVIRLANERIAALVAKYEDVAKLAAEGVTYESKLADVYALLLDMRARFRLPHYGDELVVSTGRTSSPILRSALTEINLIPVKACLDGARLPTGPFAATVPLAKFFDAQSDSMFEALGYVPNLANASNATDAVHEDDTANVGPPLKNATAPDGDSCDGYAAFTPESLHRTLSFDYETWLGRRLALFGLDIPSLLSVVSYNHETGNPVSQRQRTSLQEYEARNVPPEDTAIPPNLLFDTLIVATCSRPLPIIRALSHVLDSGACVVVYSTHAGALAEAGEYINSKRCGQHVAYFSCVEQEQQVLPGRTHPIMTGPAFGGYLLTYYALHLSEVKALNRNFKGSNVRRAKGIR